jgi:phage terminase small subunit
MALTNKRHKQFVEEYMSNGMNATQAYLSTYPKVTEKTASANGSRLLVNAKIKAEIERLQAKTSKSLNITKESLIKDLIEIKELCKTNPRAIHNSIKAVEVINKMLGFNEPDKVENKITGINIKDLVSFDDE